jgi:hypothetical protein
MTGSKGEDAMTAKTTSMTGKTTSTEARTTAVTGSADPGRYLMGQDAQLHDTRTGLVIGPWSDEVKRANTMWHKARRRR